MDSQETYAHVNQRYSTAAQSYGDRNADVVAKAFGYSAEDLTTIPKDANLGLSCGNPLALATLQLGETVVDLGSGAGLDVFLAAAKLGPSGKAIGIDMNETMLARARKLQAESGRTNVDFIHARITAIPLPAGSVDCVISNCVVNLVPEADKQLVFNEVFRLLKPGGRIAISDILAKQPLPVEIRERVDLYVGCVAGASEVSSYERYMQTAGFKNVVISDTQSDLNVYLETGVESCCSGTVESCCNSAVKQPDAICAVGDETDKLENRKLVDLNQWVGSYKIFAVKSK